MTRLLSGVLSVLCVVGVSGLSMAGTSDTLQGQAEKRNQASKDAQEAEVNMKEAEVDMKEAEIDMKQAEVDMKDAAGNIKEAEKERAIAAQRATQQEAGGIIDNLREGAKGEVNQRSRGINSTIDNLGK